jgi:hypothetical protein
MSKPGYVMKLRISIVALATLAVLSLAACSGSRPVEDSEYNDPRFKNASQGRMFGDGSFFSTGKGETQSNSGGALGVNAYLWRGALDTLSFMPLVSADPFGGVIITDWYQPAASSGERFKATAYILGRALRADGVKVSVFRQVAQNGVWVDDSVSPLTNTELENKVLARARELRTQSGGS